MVTTGTVLKWAVLGALLVFSFVAAFYQFVMTAPIAFVPGTAVIVDPGQTISGVAQKLYAQNVVRSPVLFRSLVILYGGERKTSAGMYVFDSRENVFKVAHRIAMGDYGYVAVKLTLPEGLTSLETAGLIHDKFPHIDEETAASTLRQYEGKLFPETYFFPPQAPLQMIQDRLLAEFEKNMKPLRTKIAATGRSEEEIIILASILEEEVQNDTDRRLVADLFLRRLDMGMLLQADSALGYITGKGSLELTLKDLQMDSPYNLYKYKGFPPTPISNPGIAAINAAIEPTPNKYIYFLSDKDGINHFAITYDEHLKNRKKYLGK
jgi:UPF0755 protein